MTILSYMSNGGSVGRLATLVFAGIALLAPGATAVAQNTQRVTTIVRDFSQSHPDFNVTPTGHYAGLVGLDLAASRRPDFTGPAGAPGTFGHETAFSNSQSNVKTKQIATRVTLGVDATVTSITAYVSCPAPDRGVRYAIYSDLGGEPDTLLAESATVGMSSGAGWFTLPVPDTIISAGTYWLALGFQTNNQNYFYEVAGGQTRYNDNDPLALSGSGGYSPDWGVSSYSSTRRISIHANYGGGVAGGFHVDAQWRDRVSNKIAPHLYTVSTYDVPLGNGHTTDNNPVIDSYNPLAGPYGGSNVGTGPNFVQNSPMPAVSEPTGMPPPVDVLTYQGNSVNDISNNIHCKEFIVQDEATVRIHGDVTLVVEELFKLESASSAVEFMPGATLTLYVKKYLFIQDHAVVDLGDPSRFTIISLGVEDIVIQNNSQITATIIAPTARLYLHNLAEFYGTFVGQDLHVQNGSGFHLTVPNVCGVLFDDTAGAAGVTGSGGITSTATFDQWYRDVLGVNLSTLRPIELIDNGTGVYEYLDDDFDPIGGMLNGNEGDTRNKYFTLAVVATFTYERCTGQFVDFQGTDDAWLFIGGDLVMDLGGVVPGTEQYVDVDRFGLVDGAKYMVHFFYAHRQAGPAVFRLRTNVVFSPPVGLLASTHSPFD